MIDQRRPLPRVSAAVLHTIATMGPRTGKQLRETLGVARRTLYAAIQYLKDVDYILERPYLRDTRSKVYVLKSQS